MLQLLVSLTCTLGLAAIEPGASPPGSYIHPLQHGPDGKVRVHTQVYLPQPGDMVFFDDHNPRWEKLYHLVGSGPPFHSGIAVLLPDGRPAYLEAGPDDTYWCNLLHAIPRLQCFQGDIYIRRVRRPLSKEASDRLTEFALAQNGKRYALCRLLLQATPFCCRAPLRTKLFGATYTERCSWLCSEVVVAAGTTVGLFNPRVHLANTIYPRDIVTDRKYPDLALTYEPPALWTPTPSFEGKQLWPR